MADTPNHHSRRSVLGLLAGLGLGTETYRRAVAAQAGNDAFVTKEMLQQAEWVAGIELTDAERETTVRNLRRNMRSIQRVREVDVDYNVPPSVFFNPAPHLRPSEPVIRNQATSTFAEPIKRPKSDDDLAFMPVRKLAQLIKTRQVRSVELTKLYIDRLKKYDPLLHCVVSLTEDLALKQAARADQAIASGEYRGPLHGIPWGAKDLMAVPNYKTTWGATPFRDQQFDHTATIAERLEEAGAVLVAKLSLGALAMGDKWMEKMTRNPWNPKQGSSGSSAGSACAASAGLVGFAIGTETLGSIVSPSRRCGSTGLRPTFGRISRYGLMPLSWSMDKAGPICRAIEDCALVLDAIHGSDGNDPCATDQPFAWPPTTNVRSMRIGFVKNQTADKDREELNVLRDLGATLVPITLPEKLPTRELVTMLDVECSSMFGDITRDHVSEGLNTWPNTFRAGQFIPAVDYIQAARVRTMLMKEMEKLMDDVDLYIGGRDLVITNLTGHPTAVMPGGFRERGGNKLPFSVTMTGQLYGETNLLAVAHAWEQETEHNQKRPPLNDFLAKMEQETKDEETK
jgi:Asp-tRNA(Asn)/Glu-tRNA(Gln) amidotransferase A subunit family amidase/Asp-tRNA(Asn)/Glu-tRNA(Gln) amidotransferase C subunit